MKPNKDETRDEFTSRCMSKLVGDEGKDRQQAFVICQSYWNKKDEK